MRKIRAIIKGWIEFFSASLLCFSLNSCGEGRHSKLLGERCIVLNNSLGFGVFNKLQNNWLDDLEALKVFKSLQR